MDWPQYGFDCGKRLAGSPSVLRLVSSHKSLAYGSGLWPKDEFGNPVNIEQVPAEMMAVFDHALKILSWQENMVSDEMPPSWMWHLDHELVLWFEKLEKKREADRRKQSGDQDEDAEDRFDENLLYERKLEEWKSTSV